MKTWTLVFREVDKESFERVRAGEKAIETRAATPKYQEVRVGDTLHFVCGDDSFDKEVAQCYRWSSIEEMLAEIPSDRIMPGKSLQEIHAAYASYPNYAEKIKEFGLVGFELK